MSPNLGHAEPRELNAMIISSIQSPQSTPALTNLTVVGALMLGLIAAGCTKDPAGSTPASSAPAVVPAAQAATVPAKAGAYKCPMHPNVTSDKPGKCPECGMNLEKAP
jgi:hypothetical protein